LEAVADAQHQAAGARETLDGAHHRRKSRDGAGAQIIAVGKSARKNDGVKAGEILRLVPDEIDGLCRTSPKRVKGVVIAIRSGKYDNTKFHRVPVSLERFIIAGV
jgi:hypothetical protein